MHLLTTSEAIDMGKLGVLQPGEYLCHDVNAFELGVMGKRGAVSVSRYYNEPWNASPDSGIGSAIIMRSGAWGDLLLMTPALRALRDKGDCVRLSCFASHSELFDGTDLVNEILPYPLPESVIIGASVLDLGNVMERETDVHATDAFAKALGVTVTDYKPIYKVSDDERQWAAQLRSTSGRPVCGIQMRASTRNRDYSADNWLKVITELVNRGWDVLLFGSPGQIPPLPKSIATCPHIYDLSRAGYTFRQSAAILAGCDAFCGVDSALIHLCHALDVPAVGLYGPFPWQIRTAKAPLTTALSGVGDCAPCFHHAHAGHHFPKDKPCAKLGHCTVLAGIPPERVVAKVDGLKPKR